MRSFFKGAMAADHPIADFSIQIDFERGSGSPARVFRSMTELIEACQEIDRSLCQSIDVTLEPVLLLEDIEAGSIKAWLRAVLDGIPDDALKNLDWKPVVGHYLVRAKRLMVDFTQDKTEITDRRQLDGLRKDLLELAEQTDIRRIPAYQPIQPPKLIEDLRRLGQAVESLQDTDKVQFGTAEGDAGFNLKFRVAPERIENLLTQEVITSDETMILKVKKPDYLGTSMWDFRHGTRTIPARVSHAEWLGKFQKREVDVRPGDALRASVRKTTHYDYDGEVIAEHFELIEVIEVIAIPDGRRQ